MKSAAKLLLFFDICKRNGKKNPARYRYTAGICGRIILRGTLCKLHVVKTLTELRDGGLYFASSCLGDAVLPLMLMALALAGIVYLRRRRKTN